MPTNTNAPAASKDGRCATVHLGAALLISASAFAAPEVDWALFDATCSNDGEPAGSFEIRCGDYGVFHFNGSAPAEDCLSVAGGREEPQIYNRAPLSQSMWNAPPPTSIGDAGDPGRSFTTARWGKNGAALRRSAPAHGGRAAGASDAAGSLTGRTGGGPVDFGEGPPPGLDRPELPVVPLTRAEVHVIDFDDPHGWATTTLIHQLSPPLTNVTFSALDGEDLPDFGSGGVGDFHVLSRLCQVAESIDRELKQAPVIVNMSFGRSVVTNSDGASSTTCETNEGACQIHRVMQHLSDRGVTLIAAAGNHQEPLFPGVSPAVISAGMLDLNTFFNEATTELAWESPESSQAWMPGNSMCIDEIALPAGSSFSAATMSAWSAAYLAANPAFDPRFGGPWRPTWDEQLECYVLSQGNSRRSACNEAIQDLFASLKGDLDATCWSMSSAPTLRITTPGPPQSQPELPSIEAYSASTHPTPESDPCVPCVGFGPPGSRTEIAFLPQDLIVDLSQSGSFPTGVFLDELFLRVGDDFHLLALTAGQKAAMTDGSVSRLVLGNSLSLAEPTRSVSLWYQLKRLVGASCDDPGECFWSSTPLRLTRR